MGEAHRDSTRSFAHHKPVRSFAKAVETGCYMCMRLWHRSFTHEQQHLLQSDPELLDFGSKLSDFHVEGQPSFIICIIFGMLDEEAYKGWPRGSHFIQLLMHQKPPFENVAVGTTGVGAILILDHGQLSHRLERSICILLTHCPRAQPEAIVTVQAQPRQVLKRP